MEKILLGEKSEKSMLSKLNNAIRSKLFSVLLDNSKIDKDLVDRLYVNRILEEKLIAPNKVYLGITPSLPEWTKIIDIYGSYYANIGNKMYYMRMFHGGFDLVDNTKDFIPTEYNSRRERKKRAAFQQKYNLSIATESAPREEFYRYDQYIDSLDNWIIHNDMGKIKKDSRSNTYKTWWLKGEPYKAMKKRSLFDKPAGRHLFAKQSALEDSLGRKLHTHGELMGDIIKKEVLQNGHITITPTSELDLPNIQGLESLTYNPITKSMERGIFYRPNNWKDRDKKKTHFVIDLSARK